MFVVHAAFSVDPERREEAKEIFVAHAERSRAEERNVDYRVVADLEDPNRIHTIERWEDEAAFETHEYSDHNQAFQADVADVLSGDGEVAFFDVDSMSTSVIDL